MNWIENHNHEPCPHCGELGHEQLIHHERRKFCESCWPDLAADEELCPQCGDDALPDGACSDPKCREAIFSYA
jgi:predicted amidophosphoribosyltransferase